MTTLYTTAKRECLAKFDPFFSDQIKTRAKGRWPFIFTALGVDHNHLNGKNCPCPACGGTDRFQYTHKGDAAAWGRWSCRGAENGGGDGFALVMHLLSCDFSHALDAVAGVLGMQQRGRGRVAATIVPRLPPQTPVSANDHGNDDKTAKVDRLIQQSQPLTGPCVASRYLHHRLGEYPCAWPQSLRFAPSLPYYSPTGKHLGNHPALLAVIHAPDGSIAGVHRIYLTAEGRKLVLSDPETGEALPCKKLLACKAGSTHGAAIHLQEPTDTLSLAEGIETALAVHLLTHSPTWACVSAGGLERVVVHDSVRTVAIFADNDANHTGQKAASALMRRMQREGRAVKLLVPEQSGSDWLDCWNTRKGVKHG